jgi:alanine racemase
MPVTLYVDGPAWREHLRRVAERRPGLVPVAKGNGYGFTVGRLARRAGWLGVDTIAVGTYPEVAEVAQRFDGDIMVLEPWRPFLDASRDPRVVHTVGRLDDLRALAERHDSPRVVIEALTSMRRFGFATDDLPQALRARGVRVEGLAVHLPLGDGHVQEVSALLDAAGRAVSRVFVSHLSVEDVAGLEARHAGVAVRPRVGTDLWHGDRSAVEVRASVLDVHPVAKGDRVGYRQRKVGKDGHLVVVSGGTAHGIALEAPSPAATGRQRAVAMAKGGLEATGRALSPFVVAGKQRWFVEPPHMQASMVFVPASVTAPEVGEEVEVHARLTTLHADDIVIS